MSANRSVLASPPRWCSRQSIVSLPCCHHLEDTQSRGTTVSWPLFSSVWVVSLLTTHCRASDRLGLLASQLGKSGQRTTLVEQAREAESCSRPYSIRALLIPLWLLCKNSEGEDVLPFHRRSDTQDSEGKRQSQNGKGAKGYAAQGASLSSTSKTDTRRLEIVHTDTNATLVERPRQFKPRFGHIAHSDSKGDRPSTAPH